MKTQNAHKKAEKCGVCFFIDGKTTPIFTTAKTKDEAFNQQLLNAVYFNSESKDK